MTAKGIKIMLSPCCVSLCLKRPKIPSKKAEVEDQTLSTACLYLPDCVRNAVHEMKANVQLSTPYSLKFPAIFLTCQICGIHDSIDLYSISSNYSIVDVVDELNLHITGIMKRLVLERGDIILLENGVLECIWPTGQIGEDVSSVHRIALNTALALQKEFGVTQTRLGHQLQSKIGISVGEIELIFVGSEKVYYLVTGDVLDEARKSLSFCGAKEVIVTSSVWKTLKNKEQYQWKEHNKDYVTVFSQLATVQKAEEIFSEGNYELLDPCVSQIGDEVEKFLHPLYKDARTKQQLQILTSLTQTVIIAVRIISLDMSSLDLLHKATSIVYETVSEWEGIVTKIIYEKDPTFCIVFGFPGYKHKDDAVRGILCAQKMLTSLTDIGLKISIGVSSGMVFCGAVGSTLRLEWCVLGMPALTSLTLVEQFEDLEIVCDLNTFFLTCRILGEIFTPLRKRLKGVKVSNLFFDVRSIESKKTIPTAKCIGRTKEKGEIVCALKDLRGGMEDLDTLLPLINVTGSMGAGKSTLVNWVMQEGKRIGYRLTARSSNSAFEEPNTNAWSILKQVLTSRLIDSESKVLEILGPSSRHFPLHLLNRRINTSFPKRAISSGDERAREMMVELVKQSARGDTVLIGVDNADYIGTESWLFLQCLLVDRIAVVVATFAEDFSTSVPFVRHMMGQRYLCVNLGPTPDSELGALACHILHVQAIHKGFLDFLLKQSSGNALHLQEILMYPPLQKHFCIISYFSVSQENLDKDFVLAEEPPADLANAKICDIMYADGLVDMKIPNSLFDLVKCHTTMNAEEQMLMRKCSVLGEYFGLRILEILCPEYSSEELFEKVRSLVEKNILTSACDHLAFIHQFAIPRPKLSVGDVPLEYCNHPVQFVSGYLRRCVLQSIAVGQRERLHLYLADLLREETNRSCESCRREVELRRSSASHHELVKQYKIPNVDFRLCQCLNLKSDILIQVEFHMESGKASVQKRVDMLLDAAESGLDAGAISKVEEILNKTKMLTNLHENNDDPDHVKIAVERLRARVKLHTGKRNDALRCLKHAMLNMNIVFPNDLKRRIYKRKRFQVGRLGVEENRCLSLGCFILVALALYDDAVRVGKLLLKGLVQEHRGFIELVEAGVLLLKALSKTEPAKSRERTCYKLINQIRQQCFKRLSQNPVLEIQELRTIIRAFKTMVHLLFETDELEAGKELGRKSFQLLKVVNHPKQLVRLLFFLTNIYFYENNDEKCLEMLGHLQDAYQQSGDSISEVIYHIMLAKVFREPKMSGDRGDQIKICNDYAVRGNGTISFHPKHSNRIFCLYATMALWCVHQKLENSFVTWYTQAVKLQKDRILNNYWNISGSICLEIVKILKMREKCFVFKPEEVAYFKEDMNESIENIRKQVKHFVPVLERDVKEIEKCLQTAMKECKVLKG